MSIVHQLANYLARSMVVVTCLLVIAACGGQSQPTPAAQNQSGGDDAAAVLQAYREYGGEIAALDAANPSKTVDITSLTGTIPAYSLTQGDPPCAGFVRTAPNLVFTLAADTPSVQVDFAGNQGTNLIVVQEGEEIVCPEVEAATLKPSITLSQAKAGRYGVWVGRIDMDKPVDGKLTVSIAQ